MDGEPLFYIRGGQNSKWMVNLYSILEVGRILNDIMYTVNLHDKH